MKQMYERLRLSLGVSNSNLVSRSFCMSYAMAVESVAGRIIVIHFLIDGDINCRLLWTLVTVRDVDFVRRYVLMVQYNYLQHRDML